MHVIWDWNGTLVAHLRRHLDALAVAPVAATLVEAVERAARLR